MRECLPLITSLRNRLKYAFSHDEVKKIVMQRLILVDGKVRTGLTITAGFMGRSLSSCRGCSYVHAQPVIALGLKVEFKFLD